MSGFQMLSAKWKVHIWNRLRKCSSRLYTGTLKRSWYPLQRSTSRVRVWNPQKVLYPTSSDIPGPARGIFQVYGRDHLCHMNGIYLVYTRYIPGIRQRRYIPAWGIWLGYKVYHNSSHTGILFQEKGTTSSILSESKPGLIVRSVLQQ